MIYVDACVDGLFQLQCACENNEIAAIGENWARNRHDVAHAYDMHLSKLCTLACVPSRRILLAYAKESLRIRVFDAMAVRYFKP